MSANTPTVIAAFEKRIENLEIEKTALVERCETSTKPKRTFAEVIEPPMAFLASPWNLYKNGSFAMKRLVLKLAFEGPVAYDYKTGYRTPQVSVIFEFLGEISEKCKMVPGGGIEPPTRGFSVHCSTPELPGHG